MGSPAGIPVSPLQLATMPPKSETLLETGSILVQPAGCNVRIQSKNSRDEITIDGADVPELIEALRRFLETL